MTGSYLDETLAVRRDQRLGVSESFGFFGAPGERIAVMSHTPLGPSRGTVIICSSILGDLPKNYRREVGLARTLASRGLTARRFHYRGCGNSDGASAMTTFSSMCEDARTVFEQTLNSLPIAFVGIRMGALVAARSAGLAVGSPLVLVEPVLIAASFFREGFRARMMRDLKDQVAGKPSSERLLAELGEKGVLDVFGYPVDRNLFQSTQLLELEAEMPKDARPILLLQMGGGELRTEYAKFAEASAGEGPRLEVAVHGKADAWWFLDDQQPSVEQGLEPVADWLVSSVGA